MTAFGLLFPKGYFGEPVDEAFAEEKQIAESLGIPVAFYDQESLGFADTVKIIIPPFQDTVDSYVYRGWMLTPSEYSVLANSLQKKEKFFVFSEQDYLKSHWFENWYPDFAELTFKSVIVEDATDEAAIVHAARILDVPNFFVKDYVKSGLFEGVQKLEGVDSLITGVRYFVEERGSALAGNLVIREFAELDDTVAELRTWWVNGKLVNSDVHPNFKHLPMVETSTEFLAEVQNSVNKLQGNFLTVDLALTVSGEWKVVEVGNGQVSEFTDAENITKVFSELFQ